MAKFTKSGFEKLLGLSKGYVSTNVKRGKLVLDENGMIDDTNELNKLFKEKRLNHSIEKVKTESSSLSDNSNSEQMSFWSDTDKRKTELDILKKEADLKNVLIKNQKAEGEVIPTELVKSLFNSTSINFITEFYHAAEDISTEMIAKLGGNHDDQISLKKKLDEITDLAIEKTKELTISQLKTIIDDYSLKRGQGESK